MLIPMADVPRWYAERKPKGTIAISHGEDTLSWEQLERNANRRARAFAAKGVKPGDFVAIGLPNSNAFFETTFAVWKCGATPTSLTWRLPRGEAAAVLDILKPSLVVGGQADWNAPNSLPVDFLARGIFRRADRQSGRAFWKAMTSGGTTGRPKVILDHMPAVTHTSVGQRLGIRPRRIAAEPRAALSQRARSSCRIWRCSRRRLTGWSKFDALGTLAPDRGEITSVGVFRADHDAQDLGASRTNAQPLRSFESENRDSYGARPCRSG